MAFKKRVRIIKKIREAASPWRFISLDRIHGRYVWDKRPGYFFIEWWEGRKRHRQMAGHTPSEALEAQRRKANELIGELVADGKGISQTKEEERATVISDAITMFLEHVGVHSPDKPKTVTNEAEPRVSMGALVELRRLIDAHRLGKTPKDLPPIGPNFTSPVIVRNPA